jgi:antitoxin ParD1/3/4
MPIRTSLNVSLTPELEQFVQSRVASGRYQTASEVIREGLRLLEERERARETALEELRAQLGAGSNRPTAASSSTVTPCSRRSGS